MTTKEQDHWHYDYEAQRWFLCSIEPCEVEEGTAVAPALGADDCNPYGIERPTGVEASVRALRWLRGWLSGDVVGDVETAEDVIEWALDLLGDAVNDTGDTWGAGYIR